MKKSEKHFPVKNVLLATAVALVLVFFVSYAISTIYSSPKYEDFCGDSRDRIIPTTQEDCEANGGQWQAYSKPINNETGYCDAYATCNTEYSSARDIYERNLFFTNIILGLIIVFGSFLFEFQTISNGFMGGGILLLVYGSMRYWGELSDWLRTTMLGVALVILVWIGYKKLR